MHLRTPEQWASAPSAFVDMDDQTHTELIKTATAYGFSIDGTSGELYRQATSRTRDMVRTFQTPAEMMSFLDGYRYAVEVLL